MRNEDEYQSYRLGSMEKVSPFILERLEEMILLKEYVTGEPLPAERKLAETFGCSREVVRKAIDVLVKRNLLEKRLGAKGGTFVLPITSQIHQRTPKEIEAMLPGIEKLLEFRNVIEPQAARLAALRITPEELEQLERVLELSLKPDCTREQYRSYDVQFHLGIAKASQNVYFETTVRNIRTKINAALDLLPGKPERRLESNLQHNELLQALRNKDERIADLMERHIGKTMEIIRDVAALKRGDADEN